MPRIIPEQLPLLQAQAVSVLVNRIDAAQQVSWTEWRTDIVLTGGTSAQAGDLALLGPNGKFDPSVIPNSSGITIQVAGVSVPDQSLINFVASTGIAITYDSFGSIIFTNTGASSTSFTDVTTGTNTIANMVVGTGATVNYENSGTINASDIGGINVDGNDPTHAGMVLISQPGNASAIWADPQVQGLYAAGSSIASPPAYVAPTTIQPILIGAADPSGNLQNLNEDASGNLRVTVENFPSTQAVSGTVAVSNFPTEFEVTQGTSPWVISGSVTVTGTVTVDGTVAVSNFPSTQPVSGTVTVDQGTSPWVTQVGVGGVFSSALNQDGSGNVGVNVENPITISGTIPVSGTITVSNAAPTINAFHTMQATAAGNSPVWTPAAGKKFRLTKFQITATEDRESGAGGDMTVQFYDGSNPIPIAYDMYVPINSQQAGLSDFWDSDWIDLGTGYLSSTAGNVLNINLSVALTNGNFRVTVCGDEE